MGGCSSKSDTKDHDVQDQQRAVRSEANSRQRPHRVDSNGVLKRRAAPAVEAVATQGTNRSSKRRGPTSTVDFPDFKDKEKNVVETMLESNKGLRMAEINFNDLKLQKIIGAGAFGEVIKGTYCGTPVVVKRMLRTKITEDNLRMFGDEIQLMMNLRHPNIVQFIGASWNSYSNMCVRGCLM